MARLPVVFVTNALQMTPLSAVYGASRQGQHGRSCHGLRLPGHGDLRGTPE